MADEAYEAAVAELEGELEESLTAAGFGSVDTLLSPAQRRAGGLRRRPRRRPLWQLAAAGLGGAAVLAVGGILAVNLFGPDEVTTTTAAPTTTAPTSTTTTLPPEPGETPLGIPKKTDRVAGQWSFRADIGAEGATGLPGVSSRSMLPSADGFYWQGEANDQIRSSPAIFGETVMFGSDDGSLYGYVVTSDPPLLWNVPTGGAVVGAPIVAEVTAPGAGPGSTDTDMRVFFGSLDGRFRSRDAFQASATTSTFPVLADPPLAGISAAALVMDDRVFFGTEDGQVYALDAGELEVPVWDAPFDAQSKVTVAPVGLDGFVYVGTEAGVLWKIDAELGTGEVCYPGGGVSITSEPVIADGIIYIPIRDSQSIDARRAGSCGPAPSITLSAPVESSPAVDGDILYTGNGRYLEARDLATSQTLWTFPGADGQVGGLPGVVRWPVVVKGGIYFTSDDGWLWAVDKDGQELWSYNLGARSTTSPAPGTGVVFVTDLSGTLHAIGCDSLPDCAQPDS